MWATPQSSHKTLYVCMMLQKQQSQLIRRQYSKGGKINKEASGTSHSPAQSTTKTQVLLSQGQTATIITDITDSVYDLPSKPMAIWYLHAVAGFPTKTTWLDATRTGALQS